MAETRKLSENLPQSIGYVVGGGLKENLNVRLTVSAQAVQEGSFIVIESGDWQFYGIAMRGLRPPGLHQMCGQQVGAWEVQRAQDVAQIAKASGGGESANFFIRTGEYPVKRKRRARRQQVRESAAIGMSNKKHA